MSDIVTCKCLLAKSVDPTRIDYLMLAYPDAEHSGFDKIAQLPCRPKGQPRRGEGPEWEYEERDGRLHMQPSMLDMVTHFHTAYNWNVDYAVKEVGASTYDCFFQLNPQIKQWEPNAGVGAD